MCTWWEKRSIRIPTKSVLPGTRRLQSWQRSSNQLDILFCHQIHPSLRLLRLCLIFVRRLLLGLAFLRQLLRYGFYLRRIIRGLAFLRQLLPFGFYLRLSLHLLLLSWRVVHVRSYLAKKHHVEKPYTSCCAHNRFRDVSIVLLSVNWSKLLFPCSRVSHRMHARRPNGHDLTCMKPTSCSW